jgi:alpha/beta superfamily hydrolase
VNVDITTSDRLTLQGRWDLPEGDPEAVVALAHPHPLMGGSMDVPLIRTIAGHLCDAGVAVLRFNFRGVGASEGGWSGGGAEIEDLAAAVDLADATYPDLPAGIAGWSFGAFTALRWQARADDGRRYAGIAPPVDLTGGLALPAPAALPPARRLFVIGDRDQFTTVDAMAAYAGSADATLEVVAGSDHFFHFRDLQVAALLVRHLAPEG